ncbi:MAG: hypothetical protein M0Z53_10620 [Thermaerobacter sp.]|nr:hypothetical protein [Thermaerobacter sp.]
MSKSLAFFHDQVLELSTPIFSRPKPKSRGRRNNTERHFPNGVLKPTREELLRFILSHVLYQIDTTIGGPIFCKYIMTPQRSTLYHVVFGPHPWTGVWEVVGNRRMFDIRAEFLTAENTWVPQIQVSPGNYIGVDNLNGIELEPVRLRNEIIRRGFALAEEYDHYAGSSPAARYRAMTTASRGIWM